MRLLLRTILLAATTGLPLPVSAGPACEETPSVVTSETLRVASLNIAHGRGQGVNQMLQRTNTTRANLGRVAELLAQIDADLVGLQEADGPSRWSGGFNHVETVSEAAAYPCLVHGLHAQSFMYAFGTALLSRARFLDTYTHDFAPSPPTTTKGFTAAELAWNPKSRLAEPVRLHVISMHLDFSRQSVREAQIAELREQLEDLAPPLVVMGDFNVDWSTDGSVLKAIAEQRGLSAWQPEAALGTYQDSDKRLDWILISDDLEFVDYRTAGEVVSDHRAVIADLRLRPSG